MTSNSILKFLLAIIVATGSGKVNAQNDSTQRLADKVNRYYNKVASEKLFIHTDRSLYLTGEILWFKIYCVDASLNRPLHLSKVAYVEIVDQQKNAVLQTKVCIDGTGEGSMFLPASLTSGNYVLRAYTNWMKNFDSDLYFHQVITIVNPFIKLPAKPAANTSPEYDIQFFPEGGELVYGLESKVGFRVVDKNGKGISFNGQVVDENNNTLISFAPLKFGIGNFTFTPVEGHRYKAIITDINNQTFSRDLPSPKESGYVLTLSDTTSQIIVSVAGRGDVLAGSSYVYLLAHAKQNIISCERRILHNGAAVFDIEKQKVQEGITHITLFNENLQPVCERLYFVPGLQQLNLEAKTDVKQYAARKKVRLDLISTDTNRKPMPADLSVAVYRDDSLRSDRIDIKTYLELTSELSGNIESPSYYLTGNISREKLLATDNLMLTHGWSRFNWRDVLTEKEHYEFIPEIRSHVISGSIKNASTDLPEKNVVTFLVSPEKNPHLLISRSDASGRVQFETQNFYGTKDIAVTTQHDSTYLIQLLNPFSDKPSSCKIPTLHLNENSRTDLEARAIQMQVQNLFFEKSLNKFKTTAKDTSAFYGKPDRRYFLDDYTRFPTMEEVMREYVAEVIVRKHNKRFYFYNRDAVNTAIFNIEPLVLLDGVPIFNTNKVIAFDPRKIKRLDVMARTYFLGPMSFPGVVSYSTYKGDLGGFQLDPKTLFVNYEGVQSHREFFSPVYETQQSKNSTLPDPRSLLFWSPSIQTDGEGKAHIEFYSSDVLGKFKVEVQGLSESGKPAYSFTTFEVKDKLNY